MKIRKLRNDEVYVVRFKENKEVLVRTKDLERALYWNASMRDDLLELVIMKIKTRRDGK